VGCVLFAETAVLFELNPFGIVLFVFHIVIVALFAFGASQCDFGSHI
jgi:hypothetical protein